MEAEFAAPASLGDALELLSDQESLPLAGGTALTTLLRSGLARPSRLVWLGRVAGLDGVAQQPGRLRLGGMLTLDRLSTDGLVRRRQPALGAAAGGVGNLRVRCSATLGGHVAHADPRQDLPPLLLALGAVIHVESARGSRSIEARDFFRGLMETALEPGEIVAAVEVPDAEPGRLTRYARFNPASAEDYPTVSVAASVVRDGGGRVTEVALAVGAVSDRPRLLTDAVAPLLGRRPSPEDVARAAAAVEGACDATSDARGSAAYKARMAALWTRRLLGEICLAE